MDYGLQINVLELSLRFLCLGFNDLKSQQFFIPRLDRQRNKEIQTNNHCKRSISHDTCRVCAGGLTDKSGNSDNENRRCCQPNKAVIN